MKNKEKRELTITSRIEQDKKILLDQLAKTPIIQMACEKSGTSRTTYYRWKNEDAEFAKNAEIAVKEGQMLMSDMAESQLLAAIRDRNLTAIIFWLKNHHPAYTTKVELSGKIIHAEKPLTPEEEELIKEALSLALPQGKGDLESKKI